MATHQSVLDHRVRALAADSPSDADASIEDWLLDVANARGARVVQRREPAVDAAFRPPSEQGLSNEELVVAICLLQRRDRPQILRLAGQLISREAVDVPALIRLARRERAEVVLGEMARQALRVDPRHPAWLALGEAFPLRRPLSSPVIHWQRLAWPVMTTRGYNAERWELVR